MEALEVVDEYSTFAEPLAIELTPEGLSPACVRDGEVEAVWLTAVLVSGYKEVAQTIGVLMLYHLRVTCGS